MSDAREFGRQEGSQRRLRRLFDTHERRRSGPPTSTGRTVEIGGLARAFLVEVGHEASRQLQQWVHEARLGFGATSSVVSLDTHPGAPAIAEDVRLDKFIQDELRNRFGPDTIVYGEEMPAPTAYEPVPRNWVVEVDAIDGSHPFKHIRHGYSTSLTASQVRRDGRLKVMAHMTVSPTGMVSCSPDENAVHVEVPGTFGAADQVYRIERASALPGTADAMAMVAAKPDTVENANGLWNSPLRAEHDISMYTVGAGNPAIVNLLLDGLGWIYEPRPTKSWDLSALIALELAGGRVYDVRGQRRLIVEEFEELSDLSANGRTMPGYIAVSSAALRDVALQAIAG